MNLTYISHLLKLGGGEQHSDSRMTTFSVMGGGQKGGLFAAGCEEIWKQCAKYSWCKNLLEISGGYLGIIQYCRVAGQKPLFYVMAFPSVTLRNRQTQGILFL
jgi:hypothetical protein